jgi:phytoene synthase
MTPTEYCQSKVALPGSSLYYSLWSLPTGQRQALTALYALQRELAELSLECQEPAVAQRKLQWWREEIPRLFMRRARHPVTQALAASLERFTVPAEDLQMLLDGVAMDLDYDRYPSFQELSLYCQRLGGSTGVLAAEILGYGDPRTRRFAHTLGLAQQLLQLLRNILPAARRGRYYLPEDELRRFGIDPEALLKTRTTPALKELFQFQVARIWDYQSQALSLLPEQDRYTQRSALVQAELSAQLLVAIEADGYRLLEHHLSLTPLRKFWIAWRTLRRERRRQRHYQPTT